MKSHVEHLDDDIAIGIISFVDLSGILLLLPYFFQSPVFLRRVYDISVSAFFLGKIQTVIGKFKQIIVVICVIRENCCTYRNRKRIVFVDSLIRECGGDFVFNSPEFSP